MRNLSILLCLLFLISCKDSDKKTQAVNAADSARFAAENPEAFTPQEYLRYRNVCEKFFDSLLPAPYFNGSILVARKGTILYEAYRGYKDPQLHVDSLRPNDAFHLASVSKTFTGMAVLWLKDRGKLQLDDSLQTFFKDFPYKGITVKMLLNHRSGLPNYVHYLEHYKWDKKQMVTNADVLRSLFEMHPPLEFQSGKHFAYCNTNYALLALIIETVSGMPYKTFMETNIFKPLQMNDTYVFTPDDMGRALPSFEFNNRKFPFEFLDVVYGDKNIYSTVRDMLKWDQALYPGKLFQKATLDSAFAGYSFEKEGKRNYGLGWRMTFLDNGKKLLFHNGWWHGNNTVFIRLPDEEAVIIVLSNKFNRRVYSARALCNLFGDYEQSASFSE